MYYLINEECFIGYKTRGEVERFISGKAQTASLLNDFKNDPFYTLLMSLFTKKSSNRCFINRENQGLMFT